MGCGKTTIGRPAAKRLGLRFLDMDAEIERLEGMPVSEIFAMKGEDYFREAERDLIRGLGEEDNVLVATGGGAPCFHDNMEEMNRLGCTIYLCMSPEKLTTRLLPGQAKRPLVRGKSPEELTDFIRTSLGRREETYRKAKLTIDCDGVSDEYIANHISAYLDYCK